MPIFIDESLNFILAASIVSTILSLYFLISFLRQLKKVKLFVSLRKLTGLIIFSLISVSSSLLLAGMQGYQSLTMEVLVADIAIVPKGERKYLAIVEPANGGIAKYELAGDEIMFEANILKWKPWANILGLTTAYRLDRIRGRYKNIDDERNLSQTVYSIEKESSADISIWRAKYQPLTYLLDVEHGSASYVSANEIARYKLMVTTDGLLLRPDD